MLIGILFLFILLAYIVLNFQYKKTVSFIVNSILYVIIGVILAFVLFRIIPPIYSLFTALLFFTVPLMRLLNFASLFSSFLGLFGKVRESAKKHELTKDEALDILCLKKNAKLEDVNKAYTKLVKKHHPDVGGSNYVLDKITKAKNLLLEVLDE